MSDLKTSDITKIISQIVTEINTLSAQEHEKHAKECIEQGVEEFYSTYSPIVYGRTGGLKTFARPRANGEDFTFQFGPEYGTSSYNAGLEYIFNKVFMLGYHGGADSGPGHPAAGIPYWRTPYPYYRHWGRSAPKAPSSPYQNIIKFWNNYCINEWPGIKQGLLQDIIRKYWDVLHNAQMMEQLRNINIEFRVDIE